MAKMLECASGCSRTRGRVERGERAGELWRPWGGHDCAWGRWDGGAGVGETMEKLGLTWGRWDGGGEVGKTLCNCATSRK